MPLCACEDMWLNSYHEELGLPETKPTSLFCNNKATIFLADRVLHKKNKHVERDIRFVREKIASGSFVHSRDQLDDVLTKAFNSVHGIASVSNLCLVGHSGFLCTSLKGSVGR